MLRYSMALLIMWLQVFVPSVSIGATYRVIEADKIERMVGTNNLLKNSGWEVNTANWTASAGTYTRTTTSANIGFGNGAGGWDAAASGNTLTSTAVAIPAGLYGKNGVASCNFQTPSGTATHEIQAYDGTNILAEATITSSTTYARTTINFPFPTSGNIQLRIYANADEPQIYIDDCILGDASLVNLSQVNQATLYGAIQYAGTAGCEWETTSAAFANFSADANCPTPTTTNNASAPDTKIPGITFSSLPPGDYLVQATDFSWYSAGHSTDTDCMIRFSDGTNNFGTNEVTGLSADGFAITSNNLISRVSYSTAQSNVTIQIQGTRVTGNGTCRIGNGDSTYYNFKIAVYRFPTTSELAVRPETLNWYVDATMDGASPSLGTSAVTSYTEITNGSLTLKPQSGSAPVGVMCSSTNAATAPSTSNTTCSVGDESIGMNFVIPRAGIYEVCGYYTHFVAVDNAEGATATFQWIETPTNAQTLTLEGGTRLSSKFQAPAVASSTNAQISHPMTNCSLFKWDSAGTKGVRLMYEQSVDGTPNFSLITADADASNGQRNMRFTVKPWTGNMAAPVLVGSSYVVSATITGANPSMGTSAVTSYTEITDAGLTMTPASNSEAAGIMCSSTNAAATPTTSTSTCSAGSESVGVAITAPSAGWYEACFSFTYYGAIDASGEAINPTFQVIETPTNAQTLTQEAGARYGAGISVSATGTSTTYTYSPTRVCGQLYFSSPGSKGIRLMYEQSISGTPTNSLLLGDQDTNNGQRSIHVTVKKL